MSSMNYSNIIFDLDGTLTDPNKGVYNSLVYALRRMNYTDIPEETPTAIIGPPLQKSFKEYFGMNEQNTKLAVEYFREYYGKQGLYENTPYQGIEDILASLSSNSHKLFVATSKYEEYAWKVIRHFELDKYFDDLQGADYDGKRKKADFIEDLMTKYRLEPSETVMVGDTVFDIIGANAVGIDSIAVGYGYGKNEDLMKENPTHFAEDVDDLAEFLVS